MAPGMATVPLVDTELLEESWQLVVVVTSDSVHQVRQTLDEVQLRSFSSAISVLGADDPSVRETLTGCRLPVDYTLPACVDSDSYWSTVLSSHVFEADRTIFLLAGTSVPEHWDARLVAAGQRAADAVAIAPLCARHPILSVFANAAYEPGLTVDEIDQWLNDYVDGIEFTVPVMLQSCLLLQGKYWREKPCRFANDQQLLDSLRLQGKWVLATDQVYVDDSNTTYNNDVSFLPQARQNAYFIHHPLASTRHALRELALRWERPPCVRKCLPVQLHIGHSWGGGLGRWMEDFITADVNHNHLVLRSLGDLSAFGQKIALYHSTDMGVPIRTWMLCDPILSVSLGSFEYRRIIEELVADYSVESLVISSFIGHSLDLLRSPLPTTCVLHDFFPFCPALYATFESPCHSCTDSKMRACSRENPIHSFFNFETDMHWMAARSSFIDLVMQQAVTLVAPTRSVVERYRRLEPRLEHKQIHVVAHGLDESLARSLVPDSTPAEPVPGDRLRIVVLGRLTPEKGADILAAILGPISSFADICLLGAGESGAQFESMQGVTVMASYHKNELGDLLHQAKPDLGLLLSTVPETFSYTLSELWAAGIPVLATRLGAFADRIIEKESGWLVEPNPGAVLEKLQSLSDQRERLVKARAAILQQGARTASRMVEDYNLLASVPDGVPLARYNLPRRTCRNPYTKTSPEQGSHALHINHLAPYRRVLADFLVYSGSKMEQTPRLPMWVRGWFSRILRRLARRSASR